MQSVLFFEDTAVAASPYKAILVPYLPEGALSPACGFFEEYTFDFKIAKSRNSRYGDYRPPHKGKPALITVNGDLNPYAFLITLVHEMAHLTCWLKYKNKVNPHGAEWKKEFKSLMVVYIQLKIFPADVLQALFKYMTNPLASSCSDAALMRALKNHDTTGGIFLEDIPENALFKLGTGRTFKKGPKQRKRYKCTDMENKRTYLVHPLAEVVMLEG